MYYVYVLACGDGSLYTGMTNDLRRRMTLHAAGRGAKYTRSHPPQELAGLWRCGERTAALLDVPERVGQVFPALAQYDYAPVRGETLAHLLEEGSNG